MAEGSGTKYGWRDLGAAFDLGMRPASLLIGAVGVFLILLGEVFFEMIYTGQAQQGGSGVLACITMFAEVTFLLTVLFLTMAGQAYVARCDLLEEKSARAREAFAFIGKRFLALIATPLVPIILAALFCVPMIFAALFGKIPKIGFGLYGLFGFFGYLGLIGAVLALIFLVFTMYVGPGITAVRREGTFETTIDVVGTMRGRGLIGLLLGSLAALFVATIFYLSTVLMAHISVGIMGAGLFEQMTALVPQVEVLQRLLGYLGVDLTLGDTEGFRKQSLLFMPFALAWLLMAGSYVLGVLSSAGTITFLSTIADEDWDMPLDPAVPPKLEGKPKGVPAREKKKVKEEKKEKEEKEEKEEKKEKPATEEKAEEKKTGAELQTFVPADVPSKPEEKKKRPKRAKRAKRAKSKRKKKE